MRRFLHSLSTIFLIALAVGVYANTLNNGFVYDDKDTVVNNTLIKDLNNLPKLFQESYYALSGEMSYRPVVTLTYFFDNALFDTKPWGFHLTNILLHAANAVLLYIFLTLFIRSPKFCEQSPVTPLLANSPFLISALFTAHPVLTEAVNAISYREDLLVFFFYMATLILYLRTRAKAAINVVSVGYSVSCITYSLALLSKEMAATLPIVIYGYELVYRDKKNTDSSILFNRYGIGYVFITIAYIYLRFFYFLNPLEEQVHAPSIVARLLTVPWLLLSYLKLTLFPVSLSADYGVVPAKYSFFLLVITSSLAIAFLIAITFIMRKREKGILFGVFFFFVTLIPVYNIMPIANLIAERYLYLPATGIIITAILAINLISASGYSRPVIRNLVFIGVVAILLTYSLSVINRNTIWKNEYSLWSDVIKKHPGSGVAHHSLGRLYHKIGNLREALKEYNAALDINPSDSFALNSIGLLYYEGGEYDEAVRAYNAAIKYYPYKPEFYLNLGDAYLKQFKYKEAIEEYKMALKLKPDYFDALVHLEAAKHFYKK